MELFEKFLYFILGFWTYTSGLYYFIDASQTIKLFRKENKIIEEKEQKKTYKMLLFYEAISIFCLSSGIIDFFLLIFLN